MCFSWMPKQTKAKNIQIQNDRIKQLCSLVNPHVDHGTEIQQGGRVNLFR